MNELTEFKTQFDDHYRVHIRRHIESFFTGPLEYARTDIFTYMADGKRIRPFLIWVMAGTPDTKEDYFMHSAYAIELFHAMALTHDDIIDESTYRRKTTTPHHILKKTGDSLHIGEGLALLWGDYLLAESSRHTSFLDKETQNLFHDMYAQTVQGQTYDVINSTQPLSEITFKDVARVHHTKTGMYTFVYPLLIGHILSKNNDNTHKEHIQKIGMAFGQLFQVRDDILDMLPSSNKEQWKDIREGTASWVMMWLRDNHIDIFNDIVTFQESKNEELLKDIITHLEKINWNHVFESGARDHINTIHTTLKEMTFLTQEQRQMLFGLCNFLSRLPE